MENRSTHSMLRITLPLAILGMATLALMDPAGAFDVPQNREEFVKAVKSGARGVRMETFTLDRSFDEVYRTLEARCTPCLDVMVKRSGMVGGTMEVSSSDYNPTLRRLSADRAEFSLQVVHRPRAIGEVTGPGGLYLMAADVKRVGAKTTEVTLYRPSMGYKDIYRSLMAWADGKSNDCPKIKY